MATLYAVTTSMVGMGERGEFIDAQRAWLKLRDACGADIRCLADAYARRIRELDKTLAEIAARGPF